jgi:N utilization substance protein B
MCNRLDHLTTDEECESHTEPLEHIAYNQLSRRDIRALIFHLLYAAEAYEYQESLEAIIENFSRGYNIEIPLASEGVAITQAVIKERLELDEIYKPLLTNWRFDRISVPTMLILRLAVWEIKQTSMDPRIIINEAVELAKCFAETDAYRFINGILDKVVKQLRPDFNADSEEPLIGIEAFEAE